MMWKAFHLPLRVSFLCVTLCGFCPAERIVRLNGQEQSGRVESILGNEIRLADGTLLDLMELQSLHVRDSPVPRPPVAAQELWPLGGGILYSEELRFAEERFTLNRMPDLPSTALRGIILMKADQLPSGQEEAYADMLASFERGQESRSDTLYVISKGSLRSLSGVLLALGEDKATFYFKEQERSLSRDKIVGLRLADSAQPDSKEGALFLTTLQGSQFWARVDRLEQGELTLRLLDGSPYRLPWNQLHSMQIRSRRQSYLSDLEPLKAFQKSWLSFPGPWRRDRNVLGRPLQVQGKLSAKGLGMNAGCMLSYDVEAYVAFMAEIAIDDSAEGRGNCEFVVLGDGKELFRRQMKGGQAPVEVALSLDKVKELTLRVEPGQEMDLADHANWLNARVIKGEATSP